MAVDKFYYEKFCNDLSKRSLKHRWKDHFVKYFWPNADAQERKKIRIALHNCIRGKGFIAFVTLPYNFKEKLEYYLTHVYNEKPK